MSDDIGHILNEWKYSEYDLNVRIISGKDGRNKLQMRLDLGILQMEMDGRPDGRRPRNHETYLDYFQKKAQLNQHLKGISNDFILTPMDCFKLQQEAIQFYHRYLALMKLKDYPRVIRDTQRNLQVFDFVERYSDNDEVIWQFQQHRPYVILMNTRAKASIELGRDDYEKALHIINDSIERIKEFNRNYVNRLGPDYPELEFLTYWVNEIKDQKPLTTVEKLNNELNLAIEKEEYEKAAKIRDQIKILKGNSLQSFRINLKG